MPPRPNIAPLRLLLQPKNARRRVSVRTRGTFLPSARKRTDTRLPPREKQARKSRTRRNRNFRNLRDFGSFIFETKRQTASRFVASSFVLCRNVRHLRVGQLHQRGERNRENGMRRAGGSPHAFKTQERIVQKSRVDCIARVRDRRDPANGETGTRADFIRVRNAYSAGTQGARNFERVGAAVPRDKREDGIAFVQYKNEGLDDLPQFATDGFRRQLRGACGIGQLVNFNV